MKILLSKEEIEIAIKDYVKKKYSLEANSVLVNKKSKIIQKGFIGCISKTELSAIVGIKS